MLRFSRILAHTWIDMGLTSLNIQTLGSLGRHRFKPGGKATELVIQIRPQ